MKSGCNWTHGQAASWIGFMYVGIFLVIWAIDMAPVPYP